ncbi:MAG: shikimate kinase [Candidatus Levybacteria bacterium]|nr:shikimate kinase [Candidatus Levybacteria bacterium]
MNIVLIGMRGSGKTTVAKILAQKLQKKYVETDELIVQKMGMSIPKIIANHDWNYFRDIESEVIIEISKKDNSVISTGGGVVVRPENIRALKKHGKLFWLQVSVNTLLKRIGDDQNRPSLTGKKSRKEDMEETLKQRYQQYLKASDETINTENISTQQVAKKIMLKLKE